ncbi:LysR family transcriptional regulator [Paraferrimonas sedimenticola]|uniref:LysR family transcriptional regulator n=1 Tax=Paraferrimonas sedimenticola TaxID=375674 RepID=A0AA37RVH6_9GAMM|nr:LysR family transcriptional regulator [Paraferrimonas sedimenticola]GLP96105.1 LysR family transcriptional regulator [Paraferrimonas sedimenticola]
MFDPALLRAFIAVADTGSMNKAAKKLHRSQSTISRMIDRLEDEMGMQLFVRDFSSKRLELTDKGKTIMNKSRMALAALQEYQDFCLGISQDVEAKFRVGFPSFLTKGPSRRLLAQLIETFPTTEFDLYEPSPIEMERMLVADKLDFAFTIYDHSLMPGLNSRLVGDMYGRLYCKSDHPLAREQSISLNILEQYRTISFVQPQSQSHRPELDFSSNAVYVQTMAQALELACAGVGFAFIPSNIKVPKELIPLNTEIDKRLRYTLHALYPSANQGKPVTRWLLDYLARCNLL